MQKLEGRLLEAETRVGAAREQAAELRGEIRALRPQGFQNQEKTR